jgi:hypothetical protein
MKSGNDGRQSESAQSRGSKKLEEEILREFFNTWMEAFKAGFAAGFRDSVVEVLEARGLKIDDETRERIDACKEPDQFKAWLRKAVTASSAQELFEGSPS